jgi:hypothetical protein
MLLRRSNLRGVDLDNLVGCHSRSTIDIMTDSVVVPDASTSTPRPPAGHKLVPAAAGGTIPPLGRSQRIFKVLVYIRAQDAGPTPSTNTVYETVFTKRSLVEEPVCPLLAQSIWLEPLPWACWRLVSHEKSAARTRLSFVNAAEDWRSPAFKVLRETRALPIPASTRTWSCTLSRRVPATGFCLRDVVGGMSVYNDEWGIYLSATAHEIGYVLFC